MSDQAANRVLNPRVICLEIGYDGTDFSGWQSQLAARTVQGVLEQALHQLAGEPIALLGASRTDSGVHAIGQMASFKYHGTMPLQAFQQGLNPLLPKDVHVRRAIEVPTDGDAAPFSALKEARAKTYEYYFAFGKSWHPIISRYALTISRPLDLAAMQTASAAFVGIHDFSSFCAAGSEVQEKTRQIYSVDFSPLARSHPLFHEVELWRLQLRGSGFLKQMVRNIVGTLIYVGEGKFDANEIPKILAAKDRRCAGPTAPACGLFLVSVEYPEARRF